MSRLPYDELRERSSLTLLQVIMSDCHLANRQDKRDEGYSCCNKQVDSPTL